VIKVKVEAIIASLLIYDLIIHLNTIFPALFISVVKFKLSFRRLESSNDLYRSIDLNSAICLNVKFPVIFIFKIKKKDFMDYVNLEMTLIFDARVNIIGGWPFWFLQLVWITNSYLSVSSTGLNLGCNIFRNKISFNF